MCTLSKWYTRRWYDLVFRTHDQGHRFIRNVSIFVVTWWFTPSRSSIYIRMVFYHQAPQFGNSIPESDTHTQHVFCQFCPNHSTMKFIPVVFALATLAFCSPTPNGPPAGCTPATYSCTNDKVGWQVCDVSRKWVVSYSSFSSWNSYSSWMHRLIDMQFAGNCPPKTGCVFYQPSLSPYCVPPGFKFP
jgi:hypothetical protein